MRGRAPCAPDKRIAEKLAIIGATFALEEELEDMGARIARPRRNLRNVGARACARRKTCKPPAQPLCAQKDIRDRGRAHGAP